MKLLFSLVLCCLFIHAIAGNHDKTAIERVLNQQITEWNKGNINGYMAAGYWHSDSLLFIGSSGPRYGYQATLDKYKKAYPDTDHMGQLTFGIRNIKKLSRHYYFVIGSWALKRNAGDVSGSFTLLLHKIKGKWVIVADHSS